MLGCLQSLSPCSRSHSHSSSQHSHSSLLLSHRLSCASLHPHSKSCQDLLFCFRIILNISIIILCFSMFLLPGIPSNIPICPWRRQAGEDILAVGVDKIWVNRGRWWLLMAYWGKWMMEWKFRLISKWAFATHFNYFHFPKDPHFSNVKRD